jgi:hypothetical protein
MKQKTKNLRKIVLLSVFVLLLVALPASLVFAATSGPNDPGTGADVSDVGTIEWYHPDYITTPGTPYAIANNIPGDGGISHYLQGSSYGFVIPTGATINGITVVINRQSTGSNAPFLRDYVVSLVKGGNIVGDNKAVTETDWPSGSFGTQSYGGATDLWGTTWSAADINDSSFGVVLSATNPREMYSRDATVDYMQITVNYTLPIPTLSVTNSPVTYNGSPQAADVVGSVAGTVSNVQYDGSSTVPTNAGSYAVTADFIPDDTTNYESLTGAAAGDFVIEQVTPTLSVTNSPVTYNGSPQAAVVVGSVAGTVSNVQYGGSSTVPTDVGTYAVTADFTPDDTTNYEGLTDAPAGNFVINQATPTLSVTNSPVTYDGSPQAADVVGSVPGTVSNVQYDGSSTVPADIGTYAVTADFIPDDTTNYESLTGAAAGNFVIELATPTLSVTNSPVTYDGSPQAAVVVGSVAGTVSNVQYDGSGTEPTEAGTYAVTADFTPDDTTNYESLTGAAAGNFVIEKATPALSVTNSPVTYDGAPRAADVVGSVPGTVSNVLYAGSSTEPTDAGTYAVTADFTPTDTTNYESLTGAAAGDFVIDKATPTLSVTNSPVTYNGSPQAADVAGSVPGTVSNVKYDGSDTMPTDVGTYAVTADFTPDDTTNYESLVDAPAGDFVILGFRIYLSLQVKNQVIP